MSTLERRYRHLIALYPAWHRQRYQMEMLSTLMEGAADGQRAPKLRETADLLWNAVRMRIDRQGTPRARDPHWRQAAGVFVVLAALTMSAIHLLHPLGGLGWWLKLEGLLPWVAMPWRAFAYSAAVAACWLLVAIMALAGWRVAAALLAWAAVLTHAGLRLAEYADHPQLVVNTWPSIVCGVAIALCLSLPAAQPAGRILGRRLVVLCFVGAVGVAFSLWLDVMLTRVVIHGSGQDFWTTWESWGPDFAWLDSAGYAVDTVGVTPFLAYAAFAAVAIRVLVKVGAPVRRRLLALSAVPITTLVLALTAFTDNKYLWGMGDTSGLAMPRPPTVGQWLILLVMPVAVFFAGVLLVRLAEAREERIASGRDERAVV